MKTESIVTHSPANAQSAIEIGQDKRRRKVYNVHDVPEPVNLVEREAKILRGFIGQKNGQG